MQCKTRTYLQVINAVYRDHKQHAIKYDVGSAIPLDRSYQQISDEGNTSLEVRNAWDLSVHCRLRTDNVIAVKPPLFTA